MLATVVDFFLNLFDTSDFPARWHCGTWTEGHGWLHILSDLGVFGAYVTIPVLLTLFIKRRPDTPYPRIFWLFSAFIVSCGLTHLMEAIIFWAPAYRVAGVLKLSTALVSWATVIALVYVMPRALSLTTPAELRAEVARRTAELEERNAENEQLIEELGRAHEDFDRFAYSVSHDLRAPIRAMSGFSQILVEEHGDQLDDEGVRIGEILQKNSKRAGQLIDELLEFSRVGRAALKRKEVDMYHLAATAFEDAAEIEDGPPLELDIDEDLPAVVGDEGMFRQVWNNLAGNALKYSSREDVARVEVRAEQSEDAVRFIVRDNGVGFDDAYTDKMFEVFERLHGDEFEGTGVGLAIVAQIVERHGGRIGAQSTPGEGATVWFELPRR